MSSLNPITQVTQQVFLGETVRQNHALEHATIVLLSRQFPGVRMAGISFSAGFFVFADIPTAAVLPAATEALMLLRTTSPEMAIHERCGTNLVVTGVLAAMAAMTVGRLRRPYNSASNVILATMAALLLGRPLGFSVQRHVTTQTPGASMVIAGVKPLRFMGGPAHFVSTDNPGAARLLG